MQPADISDEYMLTMRAQAKAYTLLLLKRTPKLQAPEAGAIVWEHGRRNHALRSQGLLPIVCPIPEDDGLAGFGVFNLDLDEAAQIMDEDPGVKAGIFTYELYTCFGFPGDALGG